MPRTEPLRQPRSCTCAAPHFPCLSLRVRILASRLHVKFPALATSLSMHNLLSAPSTRPISQVVENPGSTLARLHHELGHRRRLILSSFDHLRVAVRSHRRGMRPRSARGRLWSSSDGECSPLARSHLCTCSAPAQRARTSPAAAEYISAPYPTAPPRSQPLATRLLSPGIYLCQLPRLRPTAPAAACALSGRSMAFDTVFVYVLWCHAVLRFSADTAMWARGEPPASKRTRLLPACSCPCRSAAVATTLAAVERVFASGVAPLTFSRFIGRSDYMIGDVVAGQVVPIAPQSVMSALRSCSLT